MDLLHDLRASLGSPDPVGASSPHAARYRGYAALVDAWIGLVERGARAVPIGETVSGSPLVGLEIGPPDAPDAALLLAGMHATEWIGVEVGLATLQDLAADPPRDRRVLAVPLLNVDGFRAVEDDLRQRRWRYRRANAGRIDLNRNWPTFHSPRSLPGTLFPWLGKPGARPRQAPEVDAVCRWLDQVTGAGVALQCAVSLHSIGRVILYPYGGRWRAPEALQPHRDAAAAIDAGCPEHYRPRQTSRWLPGAFAHGTEIDHLHRTYGATSLLVECSRGGVGLTRPASWLHPFAWYNPPDPAVEADALRGPLCDFLRNHSRDPMS